MSTYYQIAKGLTGKVPGTPLDLAQEAVTDAVIKIFQSCDWSFQRTITYANWLCPGLVASSGTFTTAQYSNIVIADAAATTALANGLASAGVLATTLQFRNPAYSIYNIVGYNTTTNAPYATLTLDRPWLEPLNGPGISYYVYQAYFVAPVQYFHKFIEIRDTTNADRINFWDLTQAELAIRDPQRTEFADPSYCVAAGVDQRPGTSTPGYQMFELWPQQLSYIPYSFSYRQLGPVPQTYGDFTTMSPPYPITDQLVTWRAKESLFEDAAARMEMKEPEAGKGMMLLAQTAKKHYDVEFDKILAVDLNLNNEMLTRIEGRGRPLSNAPYSNQLGQLNIGGYPQGR